MSDRIPTYYRPGNYKREDSIAYLMRRITLALGAQAAREFDPLGLTDAQWVPLLKLHKGNASTAAELARECDIDAGAMTRMLDRLEAKGLLCRVRSQEDRRVVKLELTEQGRAVARDIPATVCRMQNALLRGFERDEYDQLKALLLRVVENAEAMLAQPDERREAV